MINNKILIKSAKITQNYNLINIFVKTFKTILVLLIFTIGLNVQAQKKQEKKAKKIANEMTKALSLNKKESKAIYEIQLARLKEAARIKKEYKNLPESKKEAFKKNGSKVYNQLKNLLGKERLKQWRAYKKSKK